MAAPCPDVVILVGPSAERIQRVWNAASSIIPCVDAGHNCDSAILTERCADSLQTNDAVRSVQLVLGRLADAINEAATATPNRSTGQRERGGLRPRAVRWPPFPHHPHSSSPPSFFSSPFLPMAEISAKLVKELRDKTAQG